MSELKVFDIWMEGFVATGQRGGAQKVNEHPIMATSFNDAVLQYKELNPTCGIEATTRSRYVSEEAYIDRRSRWEIWACALFSTEEEARKLFG